MLGGNGIKHVLHDERTQILCDEIENEIVPKLLNEPMVGVVEGGRDLSFVYNSFSTVVYRETRRSRKKMMAIRYNSHTPVIAAKKTNQNQRKQ